PRWCGGAGGHRRDHDHAQRPARWPQPVQPRTAVRGQAAHRRGHAPLRPDLRGSGPGQAPGRAAGNLRVRSPRAVQGSRGPAGQSPAAVLLCGQRVQPGRPDRAGRRLRLHRRSAGDGRGAARGADPGGQSAGPDDPRPARAGACAGTGRPGADDRHRPGPEELRLIARINLLPWRAERRKQRQREFQAMLGMAALGGVLLALLVWFHYDRQISGQQDRNSFLQAEIDKVKKQNEEIAELDAKKDRLLARKKVIEELQANRSQMVHLFDSLVRTIPDGVILATLKQEGEVLTLEGTAQSNARVSNYMRNLESSGWMTKPDLSIIEARNDSKPTP